MDISTLLSDNQVVNPVEILGGKIADFYGAALAVAADLDAGAERSFEFEGGRANVGIRRWFGLVFRCGWLCLRGGHQAFDFPDGKALPRDSRGELELGGFGFQSEQRARMAGGYFFLRDHFL